MHDLVDNLKHSIDPTEISAPMPIYVAESWSIQPHILPMSNCFAELKLLSNICKYK